jgi:hypothetical protein
MLTLSQVFDEIEYSDKNCYYGVVVDKPFYEPNKKLKEISFIAQVPEDDMQLIDNKTIDTITAFSQYNIKIILEIPFNQFKITPNHFFSILSQFFISISLLPPNEYSETNLIIYLKLISDFIHLYLSDSPINFKASLYPITSCYNNMVTEYLIGKKNYIEPYVEEYLFKNMPNKYKNKINDYIREVILQRVFMLVKQDDGSFFSSKEEAFHVLVNTLQNKLLTQIT